MIIESSWGKLSRRVCDCSERRNVHNLLARKFQVRTISEVKTLANMYHMPMMFTIVYMLVTVNPIPTTDTIRNFMYSFR